MSQLPPQLTVCAACREPLEPADNFCGRCGADLSAVPPAPDRTGPVLLSGAGDAGHTGDCSLAPPAGAVPAQTAQGPDGTGGTGTSGRPCGGCRSGMIDKDGYCEHCGHAQPRERDHMEHESAGVAAVSDRGLRHHRNEDAYAVAGAELPGGGPAVIAVVSDGVSSAARPDEASAAATAAACEALTAALTRGEPPREATHRAILRAAEAVSALATPGHPGRGERLRHENAPACTIVSAVITGDLLTIGWVGDSRAYWVPDDRSTQPARLTEDDSWAAQMVAAGLMSEAEAYADERAHAITGWLGADAYEVEPHTASYHPDRPGVVLVCSDGLWNYAESAEQMADIVPADARTRPLECARRLLAHALDGGGHDNVTVAVLPFPERPHGAGSA
ncbi:PP2C family serine/threonine-protein phosphatase [Streptomyces morookaense]|uniref:PP2C family protein-serine/threonine phosphatase n=1 Tax=Streptomyces morookaense TaxID=1970 RepID=UPI0033D0EBB8